DGLPACLPEETAAVAGATAVTAGCGTGTGAAVAQEIRIERMGRRTCGRGKLQGVFDGIGLTDLSRNKSSVATRFEYPSVLLVYPLSRNVIEIAEGLV
ncbi:hypothetical protein V1477_011313, partial [Vespula maculifrons]